MTASLNSNKYEQVYQDLCQRIAALPAGMRLPTVRQLMAEYDISQATIDHAIDMLAERGLIVRRPGRGLFTTAPEHAAALAKASRVVVAIPEYSSIIYDLIVNDVRNSLQKNGLQCRILRFDRHDRIVRALPRERIDGLLVLPTSVTLSAADVGRLHDFGLPVVMIDTVLRGMDICCVGSDNVLGGAMAADHLAKLGHKKLGVLICEPHTTALEDRVNGFINQVRLARLPAPTILDCATVVGTDPMGKAYRAMKNWIRAGRTPEITGLFVVSDSGALGAMKALHEAGIAIPEELSIIGFDGIPAGAFYHPSLTTIQQDFTAIAQNAVALLHDAMQSKKEPGRHPLVPPKLVTRDSTSAGPGINPTFATGTRKEATNNHHNKSLT